jgi:hypothetical protein
MNQTYTFIALDIARERAREAAAMRRADALFPHRPNVVRRGLAAGLALVSRGSRAAARQLDARVGDDLDRALAPGK